MARIAVGGFQHETNTFAPVKAALADFERPASYPGLPRGPRLIEETAGLNLPVAGFIAEASDRGHEIVPLLWAMATPSAEVTDEAFETIAAALVEDLKAAGPLDAVYLCLHGAMVTESHQDGEGELLRRVRAVVGDEMPIVASLDLHANVTEQMVDLASLLVAYRTYPHLDMAETGRRAARQLDLILERGAPAKALRKLDFLIPLVWQCTVIEPARRLYRTLESLEAGAVRSLSFTPGFPPADIADCGPAVFAYAETAVAAEAAAERLAAEIAAAEADFAGILYSPDEAVREARRLYDGRPVVLADTQDNPGAGGASDTVGLLEALVRGSAEDAALAILYDPQAAAAAHAAGVGAALDLAVGAVTGQPGHVPFRGRFTVEAVSDGSFLGTGPMKRGTRFRLGPTALLRVGGVRVVVASAKTQASDQAIFRHLGLEPAAQKILALKSSVHFRNDFQDLAGAILVVTAPGPNIADHRRLPYRRLRPGLRLTPLGPAFEVA